MDKVRTVLLAAHNQSSSAHQHRLIAASLLWRKTNLYRFRLPRAHKASLGEGKGGEISLKCSVAVELAQFEVELQPSVADVANLEVIGKGHPHAAGGLENERVGDPEGVWLGGLSSLAPREGLGVWLWWRGEGSVREETRRGVDGL